MHRWAALNMFRLTTPFFAAVLLAIAITPIDGHADAGVRDITWADLAPGGRDKQEFVRGASPVMSFILDLSGEVPEEPKLAKNLDGTRVRLSGYVVPLTYDGAGVEEFLLVPYVGACIHVPPPPRNQIVLVKNARPVRIGGLFQAVTVTGTISIADSKTDLAETGYQLEAGIVSDYSEYRRIRRMEGHTDTIKHR